MIILIALQVTMVTLRPVANTSVYKSKSRAGIPIFINDLLLQSQNRTLNKVLKQSQRRCQSQLKFSKILNV